MLTISLEPYLLKTALHKKLQGLQFLLTHSEPYVAIKMYPALKSFSHHMSYKWPPISLVRFEFSTFAADLWQSVSPELDECAPNNPRRAFLQEKIAFIDFFSDTRNFFLQVTLKFNRVGYI